MPAYLREPKLDLPASEIAPVRRGSPVEAAIREHTAMVARSIVSMEQCARAMVECAKNMVAEEADEPVMEEWQVELGPPAPNGSKTAKFRRTK